MAIMASSVSSERAFSAAGITISKRRSRLKGDIVEALQCLKCMIRNHLIFRLDPSMSVVTEIEEEDESLETVSESGIGDVLAAWDDVWLEIDENEDLD